MLGLDHVVLRVRDMDRARDFYVDVLGCSIAHEQPALGLVHLRAGQSLIDLISISGPLGQRGGAAPGPEARNVDHFAIAVAPFDEAAMRAHLAAHGVAIIEAGPRFGAAGSGPSLYIKDLDGNIVELKGPCSSG
jgi:catechol 2,3-dioxygenase-like lactoylglutathione lyase family enzyme